MEKNIWITKGARFNASRRLIRKHNASIMTISILSLYNIGIGIVPEHFLSQFISDDWQSPLAVLLSVFILILSLLEVSHSYELKSDRLHRNAVAISELSSLEASEARKKYDELIRECPENHSPVDDKKFRAEHPHEFNLECEVKGYKFLGVTGWWYMLLSLADTYWLYCCLLFSPIVLFLLQ